ncbi:MAG TPA: TraR/DksA family transcriptional regulator [Anaeromyxobacteraceae bacterium]|nr:TraR/DksA family transcriptional regulator [Anaeromyxobacteraceae bacterium]
MDQVAREARDRLLRRRHRLVRLQGDAENEGRTLREERSPDWVDQASDEEAVQLLADLTERERAEVAEIDAALARIERGTYGTCQSCGDPVEPARLKAIPEARLCKACSV